MAYEESDLESIHNMFEYNSDADKDYQPNYGDLTSSELHALYSSPDIIRNIKSRRLRWAGHVARMGESRNAYRERTWDNSKEAESFREQFSTRSAEYVEEILSPHFGGILQFVKEGEVLVDKGQADELKNHEKSSSLSVAFQEDLMDKDILIDLAFLDPLSHDFVLIATEKKSEEEQCERVENLQPLYMMTLYFKSRAVTSWSQTSCLRLVLRNACWFESSWGKKFSHEISASVWDRCPPSIVMHSGSYDRKSTGTCSVFLCGMDTIFGGVESRDPIFISQFGDWFLTSAVGSHPVGTVLSPFPKIINTKCLCAADEYSSHQGGAKEIQDKFLKIYCGLL
ncbi:hypothetical protein ANN_26170 [Periplaneta americana]|uniref:Uncharacterized protein n=1 Tax=Periplaneta americana TaxID=6978 RepID=A0ABQ8S5L9_PERAM|nr:hypothetical protein ANN_26170 [Periplaneta americana]